MGLAASMFGPQHNSGGQQKQKRFHDFRDDLLGGQPPQQTQNMEEILRALMESAREEGFQEAAQQAAQNPLLTAAADKTGVAGATGLSEGLPMGRLNTAGTPGVPGTGVPSVEGPSAFGHELPNLVEVLHALLKSDPGQYAQGLFSEALSGYQDIGRGIVSGVQKGAKSLTGASRATPTNASKRTTAPAKSRDDIKGKPKSPSDDED